MGQSAKQLEFKKFYRSASEALYKLYRAGLEWNLAEAIVIEDREDLRSEPLWRNRVNPYHHQVTNLMTFCRRLPVNLLADDVGLGKTISAGLIASELISRGKISKIFIVCPKLLMDQWQEELETKFGIQSVQASGRKLLTVKLPNETCAIITTYQSARLYMDSIAKKGFEMLVLDEAHKLRNLYGVDNPPQVAERFRNALSNRVFKYVLMLTATPIHNRLWDLYSLVDLLATARGHENPFGGQGMFARKFIADNPTQARKLKPERRDEFRSIVYSYMSRIRRVDANLHFPDRKVQLHRVNPTDEEFELIEAISKPIQKLDRRTQISIAQALISSPHALAAQLEKMAKNGTVPSSLAKDVRAIVQRTKTTAKLEGLGHLVDNLSKENPDKWRMVVFTGRLETQTTIQAFLEERGVRCGVINGSSGSTNQRTLANFRSDPPKIHAIVSTEAGAEGINLQVANVLINYDLPWNPMIVEQRIGRIQRLASSHATVCVFNIILRNTFEEFIVGRLMEKLQLASHAIGDVEALLEAAGLDEDEDESKGFAEKIRELVIASLAGKNVEKATQLAEESITQAKAELEREEKNINSMLGGTDGALDLGPKCPKLPLPTRSMDARSFSLSALESLGARLSPKTPDLYVVELDGRRECIRFDDNQSSDVESTLCRPGSMFFERLVNRIISRSLHLIDDVDHDPIPAAQKIAASWVNTFNGNFNSSSIQEAARCFDGKVTLRVRATVAHDSYERLIEFSCFSTGQFVKGEEALQPITHLGEDPELLGLPEDLLTRTALNDPAIAEFCRFYEERLADELVAAGTDERKRKKLEDDFTPRIEIIVVGLEGRIHRELITQVSYKIKDEIYKTPLRIVPLTSQIPDAPVLLKCDVTGTEAPSNCFSRCQITGKLAMLHLLRQSAISGRLALPEHVVACDLTGKQVLSDEIEISAITGRKVSRDELKTSPLSNKRAEPEFFGRCEFTSSDVLKDELVVSQISGKRYRADEQTKSVVSGKTGHKTEFVECEESKQPLLKEEAGKCETTGKVVNPNLLEQCDVTGMKVLRSELDKCAVTGKKALKELFITSSLTQISILKSEAIRSATGKFCAPTEADSCAWSKRKYHPEDGRRCRLVDTPMYFEYFNEKGDRFMPLVDLLNGSLKKQDRTELWNSLTSKVSKITSGRCKIESSVLSPSGDCLAVCSEVRTFLGMRVRHAGFLYSTDKAEIIGKVTLGKRTAGIWQIENLSQKATA